MTFTPSTLNTNERSDTVSFYAENDTKMFFSSFGVCKPIPAEKLALVILREELKTKTCFVVPYAGFNAEKTFEREKRGLVDFGFDPCRIYLLESPEQILEKAPDYIYVPGGDPFKLLDGIKTLGLRDAIQDAVLYRGSVYMGVSAGADLATEDIAYVRYLEDNHYDGKDFSALDLIPQAILCHADHFPYSVLKECREETGKDVITLRDDQVILYENGTWQYIGEEI